jgi:hypothetical protein
MRRFLTQPKLQGKIILRLDIERNKMPSNFAK